jgi:hypothetical protein
MSGARVEPRPSPSPALVPAIAEAELDDAALEQVVGGLERVYLPGIPVAPF